MRKGECVVLREYPDIQSQISLEELRSTLEGGATCAEVARDLHVSREAVRVCAKKAGYDSRYYLSAEWLAARHHQPNLSNAKWVTEQIIEKGGVEPLSRALKISPSTLLTFLKRLGIRAGELLSELHSPKFITLICANCTEAFERRSWLVRVGLEKNPNKEFFCGKRCQGETLAKRFGVTVLPNAHRAVRERSTRRASFVRENHLKMSDEEMALKTGLTKGGVRQLRVKLGLPPQQ